MDNVEILKILKAIKEKCEHITDCDSCPYEEICDEMNGNPCTIYDDLMFLLNEEKKINNRSGEDENL